MRRAKERRAGTERRSDGKEREGAGAVRRKRARPMRTARRPARFQARNPCRAGPSKARNSKRRAPTPLTPRTQSQLKRASLKQRRNTRSWTKPQPGTSRFIRGTRGRKPARLSAERTPVKLCAPTARKADAEQTNSSQTNTEADGSEKGGRRARKTRRAVPTENSRAPTGTI